MDGAPLLLAKRERRVYRCSIQNAFAIEIVCLLLIIAVQYILFSLKFIVVGMSGLSLILELLKFTSCFSSCHLGHLSAFRLGSPCYIMVFCISFIIFFFLSEITVLPISLLLHARLYL